MTAKEHPTPKERKERAELRAARLANPLGQPEVVAFFDERGGPGSDLGKSALADSLRFIEWLDRANAARTVVRSARALSPEWWKAGRRYLDILAKGTCWHAGEPIPPLGRGNRHDVEAATQLALVMWLRGDPHGTYFLPSPLPASAWKTSVRGDPFRASFHGSARHVEWSKGEIMSLLRACGLSENQATGRYKASFRKRNQKPLLPAWEPMEDLRSAMFLFSGLGTLSRDEAAFSALFARLTEDPTS